MTDQEWKDRIKHLKEDNERLTTLLGQSSDNLPPSTMWLAAVATIVEDMYDVVYPREAREPRSKKG